MPFSVPDLTTIIDRIVADMVSKLTGGAPLLEQSLLKILAKVFGGTIHGNYGYVSNLSEEILPDLATTTFLDRHAYVWGLSRIAATFATGNVTFAGVNGTTIPIGTSLIRDDGVEFDTTGGGTIAGGTATVPVEAVEAGEDGNTPVLTQLTLVSPIVDIVDFAIVAAGGLTGGADEETDEELRARILLRIKNPPAGGSESDYEQAGLTVAGVANIYIYPNQNGLIATPGYVTAVVLGDSPKVPGAGILADVQTALDTIKPVTATIVVDPIDDVDVDITVSITPNTSDIRAAITQNLNDLFDFGVTPGGDILISQVRDAIISGGATDYDITAYSVDGTPISPPDDVSLSDFEFPVEGTFTYNTL
jgi:uncharacterized phage protein gp47/JayE